MKVAIVHDYIKEYGGAERVLEALHEVYPEAPVFTSVYLPEFLGPHRERFKDWDIRTSFLQYIPFKHKLISPFRILAPFVFSRFDLSEYDIVIVSATGAYMPNFVGQKIKDNKKKTSLICYCHTPPRYLYGYATARDWKKYKIFAFLGGLLNHFLRLEDFKASKNVDYYVANSYEVAARIKKFYRREATVIYPPVTNSIKHKVASLKHKKESNTGYYLTGGRLARAKHTDLIVAACEQLRVKLKVFGRGFAGFEKEFRIQNSEFRIDSRIQFLGEVGDEEKLELMANARGFIFAGEDEDFGIVPVEAMGAGCPVIAYKSGGVRETVVEGKTGMFFEELSVDSLKEAIGKFEKMQIKRDDCRKQAEKFSSERFVKEIREYVEKVTQK